MLRRVLRARRVGQRRASRNLLQLVGFDEKGDLLRETIIGHDRTIIVAGLRRAGTSRAE
ncbi:MAG: hypothetical protein HYY76_09385 [Acidobacteria bacterium]|nr:hypothetical protein [Acidobacteriota bacterium]